MRHALAMLLTFMFGLVATPGAQAPGPAIQGFDRLKALAGEWIDVDGVFGEKGKVAVTYRVTGGGHTVVEAFPVGTPHEMVTVYHLDGDQLVLTHYCTSNTQPRMRSRGLEGRVLAFEFAGGANIDPGATSPMHGARFEFTSDNEITAAWQNWKDGKPDGPAHPFRIIRKH